MRDKIDAMLKDVGLTEKRHALSSSLSGGMKRKLSLSIALIGDPKLLLLDEVMICDFFRVMHATLRMILNVHLHVEILMHRLAHIRHGSAQSEEYLGAIAAV